MINSTDDFLSFLQTNKSIQSKNSNSITSKKKVSFSNSVKFNDEGSDDVQSQGPDKIKATSNNVSQDRDEEEQRQDTFHSNLSVENSNRVHLGKIHTLKDNGQVSVQNQNLTDSQLDKVPSYSRSKPRNNLNGSLDLLFKNDSTLNNERNQNLNDRIDENKKTFTNDFKWRNNNLDEENHNVIYTQSTSKSNINKMFRDDLHQQSFSTSKANQNQIHAPLISHESIESAWNLVREETSAMIAQVMQHLNANSNLLQKIQETQSNVPSFDGSTVKNDLIQELRNHTIYVEDLCKGDKQQLNQTLSKLDELLHHMNNAALEDKTRLREELSRMSKLEESLAEERKQMIHSQETERKRMMEDRVAFEQWKHQNEEELRRERESVQRRDELLTERENDLNRQYADMRLNMQALQHEKVSWTKRSNSIFFCKKLMVMY